MKFSHSLQFNAVPEWSSKYIAYTTLKKLIYTLQRESLRAECDDSESSHLVTREHTNAENPSKVFIAALDAELTKIDDFYQTQESFILKNIEELVIDIENFENEVEMSNRKSVTSEMGGFTLNQHKKPDNDDIHARNRSASATSADEDRSRINDENFDADNEDTEGFTTANPGDQKKPNLKRVRSLDGYLKSPKSPAAWNMLDNSSSLPPQLILLSESRIILRKRVIGLYTSLSELKSFIDLNYTGFKKALKKFDKSLNVDIKEDYLAGLPKRSYIFKDSTMRNVDENINNLIKLYAFICNHPDDLETAKSELSIHLREHVVWERNTVWRDMIGLERKNYAANSKLTKPEGANEKAALSSNLSLNVSLKNPQILKLISIILLTLLLIFLAPFSDTQQRNCFGLLVCASLFWATETIPLFVTSLLIPILIVILKVLKHEDGSVMSAPDSSKYILSTMWNSVILLLLGGFTLAAALSKYHIAKLISTWILSKAGTNPSVVLLTIMGVALFASMWVSNVAAPVLCFSLIQPILRTLPKGSPFNKALILGIAFASNIGGMASPIASPQNMISIGAMDPQPTWGEWFIIALPVCLLSLVGVWMFLLLTFNYNAKNTQLVGIRTVDDKFSGTQWFIVAVSFSTIILWCLASRLQGIFGEMGIIALIPLVLFFGTGLLSTEDFNNYPWNIVILAMGGTALGKAVASSGLLTTIATQIQMRVKDFSLFGVTVTFGFLILVMATFVSHTVAALIVIPLVKEIGNELPDPHPRILIMVSALLCSAAMALPTSGFPNVNAICMTDEFGQPYLKVTTFITRGVPSSLITYLIIVSVGFTTMKLIQF